MSANETFSKAGQQKYEETIKVAKEAASNSQLDDETLMGDYYFRTTPYGFSGSGY